MSLATPIKIQKLQRSLHIKAKESPAFRFYCLYDKVCREDVLAFAYACCKANGGAAGVDDQTFEDIEASGLEPWLAQLSYDLRSKSYRPQAVRRVYIPKANGKLRPLGIPTIRDRVVQMAVVLLLEPIFEADLQPEQYAYRRGRSALDAITALMKVIHQGHREIVDADLSGYFDTIPHAELMRCIARRIVDGSLLRLIKTWLVCAVEERNERGMVIRSTRNRDEGQGTPQGAPISPLLSNLYMRRFVLGWKQLGYAEQFCGMIVNYADDFVICCPPGFGKHAMAAMRQLMLRLKLTVNEDKTRLCRLPEEGFDFLGYTVQRRYSHRNGCPYIGPAPSKRKVAELIAAISEATSRRWTLMGMSDRIRHLNRMLTGWANYFCLGDTAHVYQAIDRHTIRRVRIWYGRKHQARSGVRKELPSGRLHGKLGLVRLRARKTQIPWAEKS